MDDDSEEDIQIEEKIQLQEKEIDKQEKKIHQNLKVFFSLNFRFF